MAKVRIHKGFNLSELLVVISVLGIIATIIVPAAINNSQQSQQRIQLKKAMANYDSALRLMQSETKALNMRTINKNIGKDCSNIKRYFKIISEDGCTFMTTDKVWYQIKNKDLSKVAVAFKKEDLSKASDTEDKSAFLFVATISKGKLHINNPGYNDTTYNIATSKTFDYIKNKNK